MYFVKLKLEIRKQARFIFWVMVLGFSIPEHILLGCCISVTHFE